MTPNDCYTQAERLIEDAWEEENPTLRAHVLATAQVYATLATITAPPLGVKR